MPTLFRGLHIVLIILCKDVYMEDLTPASALFEANNEVFLKDNTSHFWSSLNYPNAYPPQNQVLTIKCDPGYSISIDIESLELDSQSGDFLVIKSGHTLEADGDGKVFIYKLKSKKTYLVFSNAAVFGLQVYGQNEVGKTGFSLVYKRVGEVINPKPAPPPPPEWPIPSENESPYLNIYVSGKTEEEFKTIRVQTDFKLAVSKMAVEYCNLQKFLLSKEIREDNVHIYYITQCPFSWPERQNCMKIQFAVPVFMVEGGYQLTTANLDQMWNDMGNRYLEPYGMTIYTHSSIKSSLHWWIILLCTTIILFSVLLYLINMFQSKLPQYTFKKTKTYIGNAIPSSARNSILSMSPHSLQSIPPIFEHNSYEFEPNSGISRRTFPRHLEDECAFSDNESEDEVFPTSANNQSR